MISQILRSATEKLRPYIYSYRNVRWDFFTHQANCILIMINLRATCFSMSGAL